MSIKKNHRGFSSLEVILIVVLVGLVAGVGGYVLSQNNKPDNYSTDTKTTTKKSTTSEPTGNKFSFKELKVQITLTDDLKGLSYKKKAGSDDLYFVNTPDFSQLASKCEDAPEGFASLYSQQGQIATQPSEGMAGSLKQFESRYIGYGDPLYGNMSCGDTTYNQLGNLQDKLITSLKSAFQNAVEVK